MSNVKRCVSRFFAALMMLLVVGVASAAAATTWYVDGTLGNDGNSCMALGFGGACMTIQAAINKASSGDTIIVAAALYPESAGGP